MLQASMKPDVPSPSNKHRPLVATNEGTPPPVPPRTYSQRGPANGGPSGGYNRHPHLPVSKPMRKYRLEEFQFLKLLGKGSFGKVSVCVCLCMNYCSYVL